VTTRAGGETALDTAVRREMRRAGAPGLSLAVTRHDRLLHGAAFGAADLRSGAQATASTRYLWFSMSKIATATAVAALADSGRLDLDAPVREFVAGYPSVPVPVQPTVRHLLSHTAGLANPTPLRWVRPADAPPPEPEDFLDRLLRRHGRPRHPVGGPPHYSNLGFLLLAQIVTRVSGEPFTRHVERAVLRPAGMVQTSYSWPAEGTVATGYLRAPRAVTPVLRALLPRGIVGPRVGSYLSFRPFLVDGPGYGGLVGPVTDAVRLGALHLGDGTLDGFRILSPASARRMRLLTAVGRHLDVGLGWFRPADRRTARPAFVEHLGGGAGYLGLLRIYPELDLGIAVTANTTRGLDLDAICRAVLATGWS
jgi:CubicO group peptidase (beta-lactamase class C family)